MCCCSSLRACRRRDSWDTKGRRHAAWRNTYAKGQGSRLREFVIHERPWDAHMDNQTDLRCSAVEDTNFPIAMGFAWAERRVVRRPWDHPVAPPVRAWGHTHTPRESTLESDVQGVLAGEWRCMTISNGLSPSFSSDYRHHIVVIGHRPADVRHAVDRHSIRTLATRVVLCLEYRKCPSRHQ
jgi:hypothetical protein